MKTTHVALLVLLGVCPLALVACGASAGENGERGTNSDLGSVQVALQLSSGLELDSLTYDLTGPSTRTGTIDLTNSTTVSVLLGGVPVGTGYTLTLSGAATDGKTTCAGTSEAFAVNAAATTPVKVGISCKQARATGGILVNGVINVCPVIDSFSSRAPVGLTVGLLAAAHDGDNGPEAIAYHWTASAGTLSDSQAQDPTLTCAAPGLVTLTLSASDGDPACTDAVQGTVVCPGEGAVVEADVETERFFGDDV